MSRIVPFETCIARPGVSLIEHSVFVKRSMEYFLREFDNTTVRLAGLSGVCHDVAKAHLEWQAYIQSSAIKKRPNHSACGAFLFSYLGYHFLKHIDLWEKYKILWLWLIQDIRSHHGKLSDLNDDSWLKKYEWSKIDLEGIEMFFKKQYKESENVKLSESSLIHWIHECARLLEDIYDELDLEYEEWEALPVMKRLQVWRQMTTSLISGDRFHVKEVSTQWLAKQDFKRFHKAVNDFSKKHADEPLSVMRIEAQQEMMRQLEEEPDHTFYTLKMPTGYGKTITSLKMATWFGEHQGFQKIIYVAPYLSILEQNASEIEQLFDTVVLQHHSLAILDDDPEQRTSFSQLAMESWAHSLVCTSFQQLCKAIFPSRAQDTLRRAFLKNSVIIIDEPQIFSPEVWNLFLCGIEALAEIVRLKVIFLSATMPPFRYGLSNEPKKLVIKSSAEHNRYQVVIETEVQSEETVVGFMEKNERETQALIVNTVKDAILSFDNLKKRGKNAYLVHGLMTPIHKKAQIKKIDDLLKEKQTRPLYVVSTQIFETGVNLSFQHIARALSLLPSIFQTGGRVNRHMENGEKAGLLTIFPFYQNGNIDTRSMIYPKNLQKITDRILKEKTLYTELEMVDLVNQYYSEMFRQNTYEAALMKIKDAYEGGWNKLSSVQPFHMNDPRLPIFVPYEPEVEEIDEKILKLKKKFQVSDPEQIYNKYSDRQFMANLSFEERKLFMILFNYYVLDVLAQKALSIISQEEYLQKKIPILQDKKIYDELYGLKIDVYD
ncbi:CRISPR-associated helicase Cas3' [Anoxybacillus rupiensis]|uniref:CRISPR-associated helicase Cas3 n=1 Tax=Anoxybacteroides rupiense TaxID=311460 RepID=A0ABT5W347_9BACL|nr:MULTISPECIES: CRISPR-associated helicase Cas3' [Anoxybacillus]MBS2772772.1 CRISPR-associated helicase Cas3' [Anoxybacillus rupiensis]MDE8563699.1 CRISPR-associated helicase Cas3' [Anoxybacillus rupiensis]QHC04470.1 CRISPR-associated helicase Cas3' [Anoxybacillus sp. PDR2]